MKSRLCLFLTLFSVSASWASECPPVSALSHPAQGESWVLSPQAAKQGWYINSVSDGANNFPNMQLNKKVAKETYLNLIIDGYEASPECVYVLNDFQIPYLAIYLNNMIDFILIDKSKLSNFSLQRISINDIEHDWKYYCISTDDAPKQCTW